MDNNKVGNEKEEVLPSENVFNDEDILIDVLTSLKHLSTEYGMLVQESSNEALSGRIETLAKEVGTMARDSFNLMFEKGWYQLEPEDEQKLQTEYNKFKTKGSKTN